MLILMNVVMKVNHSSKVRNANRESGYRAAFGRLEVLLHTVLLSHNAYSFVVIPTMLPKAITASCHIKACKNSSPVTQDNLENLFLRDGVNQQELGLPSTQ